MRLPVSLIVFTVAGPTHRGYPAGMSRMTWSWQSMRASHHSAIPPHDSARRAVLLGTALLCAGASAWSQVAPKVGILLMHGKNPGNPQDPSLQALRATLERQGWDVLLPDMPWSRRRYLEGNWDLVMREVATHVQALKDKGAQKIVLMGHSMGVPAAMSHAARGGTVDAMVLMAPGHIPAGYYTAPGLKAVRESIDDARAKLAAGKGDETERFQDINQGRQQPVIATARNYLSYFDPQSDADMGVTAPRVPASVPVLTVIGEKDPLFASVRRYYVDKLPKNPQSQLMEVSGGHLDTPRVATDAIVSWIKSVI